MVGKGDTGTPHRRSIRLKGYDYAQPGAYFVTICTWRRIHLFGEVVDGEMLPNALGKIVQEEWLRTAEIRPNVVLYDYEFVVMPNHIHGIIRIVDLPAPGRGDLQVAPTTTAPTERTLTGPPTGSLGAIIAGFKSAATKRINILRKTPGKPVWQRNYYEHIVRNEKTLDAIRRHIVYNPLRWHLDRYNENATAADPLAEEIWNMMQEDVQKDPRAKHAPKFWR